MIYHYKCLECKTFVKTFKKGLECAECKRPMTRATNPPPLTTVETRDNGIMARKVECLPDIEEVMERRTKEDIRKKFSDD
jgi:hypothetical protein